MKTSFACSYPSISMLALDLPASRCRFLPIADCQSFNTRSSRRPVFTLARKHKRKHKRTHAHVHARARARAHTHTHTHIHLSPVQHLCVNDLYCGSFSLAAGAAPVGGSGGGHGFQMDWRVRGPLKDGAITAVYSRRLMPLPPA